MSAVTISVDVDGIARGFSFETDNLSTIAPEIAMLVQNTLTAAGGFSVILPPVSEGDGRERNGND